MHAEGVLKKKQKKKGQGIGTPQKSVNGKTSPEKTTGVPFKGIDKKRD